MKLIDKCVFCGGELEEKEVTELVKGGSNIAILKVNALVCQRCGERFYEGEAIKLFEEIRAKLKAQETECLKPVGQSFEVV